MDSNPTAVDGFLRMFSAPAGENGGVQDWNDYWVDTAQRTVLTWDVLRQRGDQYFRHMVRGRPPVLAFDYDVVMDGHALERPVNYLLLRIRPDPAHPTDPIKRPIVVVDPRAGHGPGIGGFKADSQIGVALAHGYPCYFVSFTPHPVPGQTLIDIGRAEAAFLRRIGELHPDAEDRPVVIGNCQAGWAVAMLSAAAPELMSVVILNGAPLSYWSGEVGKNPMRYLGGLLGGTWLASLLSDLGAGVFDGANLVSNFEYLDPANTFWKKPYNLFSKVDHEAERFLDFERWWGGHFLLTKEEIRFITEELFVGNKLASGELPVTDGIRVDLRDITAPIVIFASRGDNITPPQQALNWVQDVYQSVDDIRASGRVIIYMLHESIGHLGIFVSGKVAKREHRAMIDNLDVISTLPPGLYEMTIQDGEAGAQISFGKRDFDDISNLDDSRRDELFFIPVARVSGINSQLYDFFVSPWVQMAANPVFAEIMRRTNPNRMERWLWSDINPFMALIGDWAQQVRAQRQAADENNPFRKAERLYGEWVVAGLDHFRDVRDQAVETLFYATYAPLKAAMRHEEEILLARREQKLSRRSREARAWMEHDARPRMAEGGAAEAVVRILLWVSRRRDAIDPRRFRLAEEALNAMPAFAALDSQHKRAMLRDQFFLIEIDQEGAIAALTTLLPETSDREAAFAVVDAVAAQVDLEENQEADLAYLRERLALPSAPEGGDGKARSRRRGTSGPSPETRPLH